MKKKAAIPAGPEPAKSELFKSNPIVAFSINPTPERSEPPSSAPLISPISEPDMFSSPLREAPAGIAEKKVKSVTVNYRKRGGAGGMPKNG